MHTIRLIISYDGTDYHGWQIQDNGRTVQGEIEKAVIKVFGKAHRVYGASRTDSGVHAKAQTAHFKTPLLIPERKIPAALNSVLPEDIAIVRAAHARGDFHSRFDARSKHYRYCILNFRRRDPFRERYAWRVPYRLDARLMREEAAELLGRHDFKAFQASDKKERHSVREISCLTITSKGLALTINVEADGFLYNMVRNIVGTLVDIGRGYLPAGSMKKILEGRDRTQAGPTAPAKGLFLIKVRY